MWEKIIQLYIGQIRNESDTPDIDSVPGNKNPDEDDIDSAKVMITVKTDGIMYDIIIYRNYNFKFCRILSNDFH